MATVGVVGLIWHFCRFFILTNPTKTDSHSPRMQTVETITAVNSHVTSSISPAVVASHTRARVRILHAWPLPTFQKWRRGNWWCKTAWLTVQSAHTYLHVWLGPSSSNGVSPHHGLARRRCARISQSRSTIIREHSTLSVFNVAVASPGSVTLTPHMKLYHPCAEVGLLAHVLQALSDPSLSVDVSVFPQILMLNILETKRFRGSCPTGQIGKCIRHVEWWRHRWRHMTLWHHTRDVTIFKVVAVLN